MKLQAVLVFLFCFTLFYESDAIHTEKKSRKRADFFCESNDECGPGKCCKKFICLSYLQEGELCLFADKWKIGCGCQPNLDCTRKDKFPKSLLYRCYNSAKEQIEENDVASEASFVTDMKINKKKHTRKESHGDNI